jgi:hypothetical protein
MNANYKLTRLVAAASLGSLLWAGCASSPSRVSGISGDAVAAAPINQVRFEADTHPELRPLLWQEWVHGGSERFVMAVQAPNVEQTLPGVGNDSTALLGYNPEVLNTVAALSPDQTVIIEAAGAQPGEVQIEHRSPWGDRYRKTGETNDRFDADHREIK